MMIMMMLMIIMMSVNNYSDILCIWQYNNVWMVLVGTLTVGVLIGFFLALFQIISQKSEVITLRSKFRRLQVELDSLRNQAISDDIILSDDTNSEITENE